MYFQAYFVLNKVFLEGIVPVDWLSSDMIMLYKKGDCNNPANYRRLSMMRILLKVYSKVLALRIIPAIDPFLRVNQNGFRKGKNTIDHILLLRRLIEETESGNPSTSQLALVFIDFVKAFDTLNWTQMWAILASYRIPYRIINTCTID